MLARILAHIRKELLMQLRDRGGLALLYLMPVCLVCIMAVVQDAPFRDFSEKQVHLLFRDLDGGAVGKGIKEGLEKAGPFQLTDATDDAAITESAFLDLIRTGEYQVGITVPANASAVMSSASAAAVAKLFGELSGDTASAAPMPDSSFVEVRIDPAVKQAFRELVNSHLKRVLAGLCSDRLLADMTAQLQALTGKELEPLNVQEPFVGVRQRLASNELSGSRVAIDSTQHNVPAWTIFAMFFTVVLLAGNMVKERDSGCMVRLLTMPGGASERIAGRMSAFLLVCVTQAALLFLIGILVLPLLGLAPLDLRNADLLMLLVVTLAIGAAATSYGVLVGSFSATQQRSAVFGSTSVVILSAIGGIWVPLYIMPDAMRAFGRLSPLNWSMEAYNVVLLRNGQFGELAPFLLPLLIFTAACITVAIFAERITARR
jgi:ABC-2 type transport system permease protein